MQAHTAVVAVPAAADAWTNFADIIVPAGALSLKKVVCGLAIDDADPSGHRNAPVFRLLGSGLTEQSPHEYLGPMGNIATKTTSGAFAAELNFEEYDVDIPVAVGGTITPQVNTLDEAITAGTCLIGLIFSEKAAEAVNSMSQYIDAAATTTADAWAAVGTITVPQLAAGKAPTRIVEICMGVATDQATIALLRCAARFRLTGSGIAEGGLHEYIGPCSGTGCNTAGVLGYDRQMKRIKTEIPVNAGGQILVENILSTETPTAGTAVLGVLYR